MRFSKISRELLTDSVRKILADSKENKRNFVETVELQVGLKNYDTAKDKRFSGTMRLATVPRPRMSICVLADAAHVDQAKEAGLESMTADDLKKLNKNKKLIKKLGAFC